MDRPIATPVRIGAWCVDPLSGQMSREGETVRVEARTLRLLLYLAGRAGEVVSIDELLTHVWSGVIVTQDSVYQAVASLRRLLGDNVRQPAYIATVPRLGYRLVAKVSPWMDQPALPGPVQPHMSPLEPATAGGAAAPDTDGGTNGSRRSTRFLLAAAASACLAFIAGFLWYGRSAEKERAADSASPLQKSVAVLPFLDLTSQAMSEEYFADGMTEELIDQLSKLPGLRVPSPTSSFYFKKNRHMTLAEMAKALDVAYVVDGSIRRSGATLRIAARLVRADNGFVVWSATYDRQADDVLQVQQSIANEIAKLLRAVP
jgi:transcriptional activator of cad operon